MRHMATEQSTWPTLTRDDLARRALMAPGQVGGCDEPWHWRGVVSPRVPRAREADSTGVLAGVVVLIGTFVFGGVVGAVVMRLAGG